MTKAAIDALRAEQARALELFDSLSPEEWAAPSGCDGWRLQDVACHMASVFQTIADPASIEGGASEDVEENAEVPVQARRDWSPEQVVAAYVEWSEKGIGALAALQEPPMADAVVPLGNLGSHPMHVLGNAIVFDHYCHLRHDIGAAIDRAADLPRDADALGATLEWMLAGLPQMCQAALAEAPARAVNLVFEGPGGDGASYVLGPGSPRWTVTPGHDDSAPTVRTQVHDFVSWGTKRAPRGPSVAIEGGSPEAAAEAAAVLDAINVI